MAEDKKASNDERSGEKKYPIGRGIIGIIIGFLIGSAMGYLNNSASLGLTCGFIIAVSIIFFAVLPEGMIVSLKSAKKLIYAIIYLVLVAGALILYLYSFNSAHYTPIVNGREIPIQIQENFKNWTLLSSLLRLTHIVLGLVATVCSILVAMEIKKIDGERKKWLAFTAAVSFSVLSAFDLGDKANRTRTAWREMNSAIIRYQEGVDTSKVNLINAYEEAEKIIGDVKPSPKDNLNSKETQIHKEAPPKDVPAPKDTISTKKTLVK
jgi:hypothetical protein